MYGSALNRLGRTKDALVTYKKALEVVAKNDKDYPVGVINLYWTSNG
jgi:hypothetical protein